MTCSVQCLENQSLVFSLELWSRGEEEANVGVFLFAFCMSKIFVSVGHCLVTASCWVSAQHSGMLIFRLWPHLLQVQFKMSKSLALSSLEMEIEVCWQILKCLREWLNEFLTAVNKKLRIWCSFCLDGMPGTDLQPELLFCVSSFHGNVVPGWGTVSCKCRGSLSKWNLFLTQSFCLPGYSNWSKSRNHSGKMNVPMKAHRTLISLKRPCVCFYRLTTWRPNLKRPLRSVTVWNRGSMTCSKKSSLWRGSGYRCQV